MGDKPLCEFFPHLYHLLSKKLHFVASIFPSFDPSSFSLGFWRTLFDREVLDVAGLLPLLHDQHMHQGRKDSRFWTPNSSRGFSCNYFFHLSISSLQTASAFDRHQITKVYTRRNRKEKVGKSSDIVREK